MPRGSLLPTLMNLENEMNGSVRRKGRALLRFKGFTEQLLLFKTVLNENFMTEQK